MDIQAEIDREIEIAKARWGETFELMCLQGSEATPWTTTTCYGCFAISLHGTIYSRVIAARKDLPR